MSDKMTESHVAAQCHLEAQPLDGVPVNVSSSGGIPILEHIEIEDVSSDDKTISPTTARNICNSDMSATVQAVLRTSKHERDALIAARRKLMQFSSFLKRKGFSEEDIFEKLHQDGYFSRPCERDDFGLPKLSSCCKSALPSEEPKLFDELSHKENGVGKAPNVVAPNPFVDKMKGKIDLGVDNKVFDEGSDRNSKPENGCKANDSSGKSWSQVVKEASPVTPTFKLSFVPPPEGVATVTPPDEALKAGNDKLRTTIVGSFTKGTLSYNRVLEFANNVWKSRGLVHVGQKDARTFFFRFNSENAMNNALAKGTWYIDRKPMIVHAWGTNANSVQSLPLWVKCEKLPDSYWTQECLSRLASVIGPPLYADDMTSKLEVLPFARICVQYTVGDDLPVSIPVTVLDPISDAKSIEEVLVSYPNKPLVCNACKSLGHLIGACPTVTRKWVRKDRTSANGPSEKPSVATSPQPPVGNTSCPESTTPVTLGHTPAKVPTPAACSDDSATPIKAFKNLRKVDEIDAKQAVVTGPDEPLFIPSKSQRKRLKKAQGKSSTPPPL